MAGRSGEERTRWAITFLVTAQTSERETQTSMRSRQPMLFAPLGPTKVDDNGVTRVYDPRTNTFGAYNADGTTRTFYKRATLRSGV